MSVEATAKGERFPLGNVMPVLRVASVEASVRYYVEVLGFKVDWETPGFVSVSRGLCCIFLCEGDQGHDVDRLHAEFVAAGAKIRHEPTNYPWALEMQVEDPDGNVLRFGSDPRKGEPAGEWLDMNGVRWRPRDGGGWERVD